MIGSSRYADVGGCADSRAGSIRVLVYADGVSDYYASVSRKRADVRAGAVLPIHAQETSGTQELHQGKIWSA
jgi:hypothetical protein